LSHAGDVKTGVEEECSLLEGGQNTGKTDTILRAERKPDVQEAFIIKQTLVQAKCMRCPWALQAERSATIFSSSLSFFLSLNLSCRNEYNRHKYKSHLFMQRIYKYIVLRWVDPSSILPNRWLVGDGVFAGFLHLTFDFAW
jgi:hypothetical protein